MLRTEDALETEEDPYVAQAKAIIRHHMRGSAELGAERDSNPPDPASLPLWRMIVPVPPLTARRPVAPSDRDRADALAQQLAEAGVQVGRISPQEVHLVAMDPPSAQTQEALWREMRAQGSLLFRMNACQLCWQRRGPYDGDLCGPCHSLYRGSPPSNGATTNCCHDANSLDGAVSCKTCTVLETAPSGCAADAAAGDASSFMQDLHTTRTQG